MQMTLNEMSVPKIVPKSPPKTASSKNDVKAANNNDDKSFQDNLDTKIQTDRENQKVADDQKNGNNVTAVYQQAQNQSQTQTETVPVADAQEEIAFVLQMVKAQQGANQSDKAQQALEALSQALEQIKETDPEAQISVKDLMQQIKAATAQNQTGQNEIKVDFQANNKSSLEMLAQQDNNSKAATDLNLNKTDEKQAADTTPKFVLDKSEKDTSKSDDTINKSGLSAQNITVRSYSLEQINALPKQSDGSLSAQILDQVNDKLKTALDAGKDTVKIQLQPENLGKVDIRIVRGNEGIQLFISTDTISTSRAMQSSLNQLQQALVDAGVKVGNMSVSYHGQQNQQNGQNQSHRKNGFSYFGQDDDEFETESTNQWALSALDTRA